MYAARAFEEKTKRDGLFWFYVGQLRWRFHMAVNPDLDPSGEPAAFAALMYSLGEPMNRFAGSDPDMWIQVIDEAFAWDAGNPNGFTSKAEHTAEYQDIRRGLDELKTHISENRQELLDRDKMPKDWPALVTLKSAADLDGSFGGKSCYFLPRWLMGKEYTNEVALKTDTVRIAHESPSSIQVVGICRGEELGRNVIQLDQTDEGFSFVTEYEADESIFGRAYATTVTLFRNTKGDIVLRWMCDGYVKWERASEIKQN